MSLENIIVAFAGGVFSILILLLAWIGNRVHVRLDDLTEMLDTKLTAVAGTLTGIEKDLRNELSGLDRRVTQIETENKLRRSTNGHTK